MSGPVAAGVFNRMLLRLLNDLRHVEYRRARRASGGPSWRLHRQAWRARLLELGLSDDPYGPSTARSSAS